ncbi:MAG: sigma-70 family RNA polymerase sigma factor [Planctomycetia bacterium]|nr:sigma-70 family RNA polymerase sigma factor [Planctomycetia bacterium]
MSGPEEFSQLLERIRQGDQGAMSALIRQYEPEVRRAARLFLGPSLRPYLDSIDIAQSVNFILAQGLQSRKFDIASPEKLVALAVTLVRRRVSRHWRRLRRQERVEVSSEDSGIDLVERLASEAHASDDPALLAEYHDQLDTILAELSDIEREIVELRLEGLTTAEVARHLGADPAVLRVRLSRLRQRFYDRGFLSDWL